MNSNYQTFALICVCLIGNFLFAAEIHVYPDESIQDAIDIAVDGDEIIVHPGIYYEIGITTDGKAITLRSVDPTNPEIVTSTIIDGVSNGPIISCMDGEGSDTVISGFTITNGYTQGYASGMRIYSCSPTITNCTFAKNIGIESFGGAMWIGYSSSPNISNCIFDNNTNIGGDGGAIYGNTFSDTVITNCIFSNNSTDESGGGLYTQFCSVTIEDCVFSNNSAHYGGGIYAYSLHHSEINKCNISNNQSYSGGGLSFFLGGWTTVSNCNIDNNIAETYGGGMSVYLGGISFRECTYRNNSTLYSGGGIYSVATNTTLHDCTICSNSHDQIEGDYYAPGSIISDYCPPPQDEESCRADVNKDGIVNIDDIFVILSMWGVCP